MLGWISHLNLLEPDPESNILEPFPLKVKEIISTQVCEFLSSNIPGSKVLKSSAHIKWAMECIGISFTLPLKCVDTIKLSISLYESWIFTPEKQPSSWNKEKQFFLQKVLSQYSMLFESRAKEPAEIEMHVELCKKVLSIYRSVSHTNLLNPEGWRVYLKILLGICDCLLGKPKGTMVDPFSTKLCADALQVLLSSWLVSGSMDTSMWNELSALFPRWLDYTPSLKYWSHVSKALTMRTVALLYGNSEGSDAVYLQHDRTHEEAAVIKIKLSPEHVFYAWQRMLKIIGNPNALFKANLHMEVFKGIEKLVNIFLSVGSGRVNKMIKPPSGNTILKIFGDWLFGATRLTEKGFTSGGAIAVRTLCAIFDSRVSEDWDVVFLTRFYSCIKSVLMSDDHELLVSVLMHSSHLILQGDNFPGFNMLLPYYVYAINKILLMRITSEKPNPSQVPMGVSSFVNPELNTKLSKKKKGGWRGDSLGSQVDLGDCTTKSLLVRQACLWILSSILCMPTHWNDSKFVHPPVMPECITKPINSKDTLSPHLPQIETYSQMSAHIMVLLLESLENEIYPDNIVMLLRLCYCYAKKSLQENTESTRKFHFTELAIELIVQKLIGRQWPSGCMNEALKTLSTFAQFYHQIPRPDEVAHFIVSSLAQMYDLSSFVWNDEVVNSTNFENQLIAVLECIRHWILQGTWIWRHPKTKARVLSVALNGIPNKTVNNLASNLQPEFAGNALGEHSGLNESRDLESFVTNTGEISDTDSNEGGIERSGSIDGNEGEDKHRKKSVGKTEGGSSEPSNTTDSDTSDANNSDKPKTSTNNTDLPKTRTYSSESVASDVSDGSTGSGIERKNSESYSDSDAKETSKSPSQELQVEPTDKSEKRLEFANKPKVKRTTIRTPMGSSVGKTNKSLHTSAGAATHSRITKRASKLTRHNFSKDRKRHCVPQPRHLPTISKPSDALVMASLQTLHTLQTMVGLPEEQKAHWGSGELIDEKKIIEEKIAKLTNRSVERSADKISTNKNSAKNKNKEKKLGITKQGSKTWAKKSTTRKPRQIKQMANPLSLFSYFVSDDLILSVVDLNKGRISVIIRDMTGKYLFDVQNNPIPYQDIYKLAFEPSLTTKQKNNILGSCKHKADILNNNKDNTINKTNSQELKSTELKETNNNNQSNKSEHEKNIAPEMPDFSSAFRPVQEYLDNKWPTDKTVDQAFAQALEEERVSVQKKGKSIVPKLNPRRVKSNNPEFFDISSTIVLPIRESEKREIKKEKFFLTSRVFLGSLTFLNPKSIPNLVPVVSSTSFIKNLEELDKVSVRDTLYCAILYHQHQHSPTMNDSDPLYEHVLQHIAKYVSVKEWHGFLGGLDEDGRSGEFAPFHSDHSNELIFHVSTLIPDLYPLKHSLLADQYVFIIWSMQSLGKYSGSKVECIHEHSIQIVVHPKKNNLFHVYTINRNNEFINVGPLLSNSLVSMDVLPQLLRETAMNAFKLVREKYKNYTHPYNRRKEMIKQICQKHVKINTLNNYYRTLFKLPSEQQEKTQTEEQPENQQKTNNNLEINLQNLPSSPFELPPPPFSPKTSSTATSATLPTKALPPPPLATGENNENKKDKKSDDKIGSLAQPNFMSNSASVMTQGSSALESSGLSHSSPSPTSPTSHRNYFSFSSSPSSSPQSRPKSSHTHLSKSATMKTKLYHKTSLKSSKKSSGNK
eukprot:CAMPEP_0174277400 /NCGR_PEP_ID=MMETSP0439-20130205/60910_1 /TAXON_ID=0 /ORGANISM="Stereomyxa ramosa, Strain Chinc5" /LENGTH=1694 /DNA_ID=CAMNT_0015369713 /DNA_START=10 /DNA_END=5094 /DNA_ORIENTATION=+